MYFYFIQFSLLNFIEIVGEFPEVFILFKENIKREITGMDNVLELKRKIR